jgi:hypothetical protein
MKYVKHLTCAYQDEKVQAAVAKGGLKTYAVYWIILEAIGAQIRPESVSTGLSLTWVQWGAKLLIDPRNARKLTAILHEVGLVRLQDDGNTARIEIPNILKYCDEYSRKVGIKSGHAPDKLRTVSGTPAFPASQNIKDLREDAPVGGLKAPAGAPEPAHPVSPPSAPYQGKDKCPEPGCTRRGTKKHSDGRWYCHKHDPDNLEKPDLIEGVFQKV